MRTADALPSSHSAIYARLPYCRPLETRPRTAPPCVPKQRSAPAPAPSVAPASVRRAYTHHTCTVCGSSSPAARPTHTNPPSRGSQYRPPCRPCAPYGRTAKLPPIHCPLRLACCLLPCPVPVRVPRPHPRSRRLRDLHRAHGPRGTPSRRLGPASRPCPSPGSHSETDATSIAPCLSCGHVATEHPARSVVSSRTQTDSDSDSDSELRGAHRTNRRSGTSSQLGHSDSPYCIRTRAIPPCTVRRTA